MAGNIVLYGYGRGGAGSIGLYGYGRSQIDVFSPAPAFLCFDVFITPTMEIDVLL